MASRDHQDDVDSEEYDKVTEQEKEEIQAAQTQQGAQSGAPSLPARPAGGLPGLPPRGLAGALPARGAKSSQPASTTPAQQQQPAAAAQAPAQTASTPGTGPSLPARPAGGLGTLPPRGLGAGRRPGATSAQQQQQPTQAPAAPTSAAPQQPATTAPAPQTAGAPARPTLPPRPGAGGPPAGLGLGGAARPAGLARPAQPPVQPPAQTPAQPVTVARPTPTPTEDVVDPSEDRKARKIQQKIQDTRVQLLRAAARLGIRYDSDHVQQFMGVINRVEQVQGAAVYKGSGRKVDLAKEAEKRARELESSEAADGKIDVKIKILLLGVSGTGKSELVNSLLGRPVRKTNAFTEATKSIKVVRGTVNGIQLELIDTPGLHASSTCTAENRALLKGIRAAYKWHKPHYVFWVDRLDSGRPALGELSLLGLINEALGATVWRETMVVLTHAHACRAAMGPAYDTFSRQRRNIISQLLRQAAGGQQVRNPMFLVDCHPSCPTNSFGQQVIYEGTTAVPWKQMLLLQVVGYRLYESTQALFKEAVKVKGAAGPKQADMFKQMMRARLPPVNYYVEQLCEGVAAADGWAAMEDPVDAGTEDLEAEEFEHAYYRTMYQMSCNGNPWAQKEYALMLAKQDRVRKTYREAFQNEDIEQMAGAGYEGYVTEGLDLGPTFDPMEGTNHRYVYAAPETDVQIMPTLDYYGWEHEDAISGFVAEWEGQPLNRHGWGGIPANVTLAVEKDKTSTCLQGEVHAALVHNVPPWGSRHITQVVGSFEVLRPNIKDVLYQLEINSFKDGFLAANDHAGVGLMLTRLGEGGKLTKGPMGFGLRLQDTLRAGPFKVEGSAAKCTTESAQGGKDVAWGARAFVRYDHLPGVGMLFDFYQQRTKDADPFQILGTAANITYDFPAAGCACGVEMDFVPGQQSLHVDLNIFSGNSYKPAWLLLLPAFNYIKGMIRSWTQRGGEDEVEGEFDGEEGDMEDEGTGLTPEQQAQLQMQQMMKMMGMAR